ncbi:MAG: HAMP domain-containing histidine kinase [Chloroflexi bacterium]|nr:HAMP domain-containing histidine kinase [Chloroflexota bacterium]
MGLLAALLIGSVFVVEVFLHRAYRRRREEEQRRVETDSQLARVKARSREAEIAKHERERFLSIVSHELKTPLTSILAFTDILTRDSDGAFTERQLKHLGLVKRNGRRLDGPIDDVLAVSRIETGRLSLENRVFKLSELCWELNQSMASIFETKSQEFVMVHPAGDCAIMADRNRVFQAISNLLSNASKYSPENTVVSLGCAIEGGSVFITVTDQGIGLAADDQRHIFDLFYRAQNEPTRTVGGLGVGLAIVKAIAEAHGGSVDVVSAPGTGSAFAIEIPGVIASPSGKYPISRKAAA